MRNVRAFLYRSSQSDGTWYILQFPGCNTLNETRYFYSVLNATRYIILKYSVLNGTRYTLQRLNATWYTKTDIWQNGWKIFDHSLLCHKT